MIPVRRYANNPVELYFLNTKSFLRPAHEIVYTQMSKNSALSPKEESYFPIPSPGGNPDLSFSICKARREDLLDILGIERISCPSPWDFEILNYFIDNSTFLIATTLSIKSPASDMLPLSKNVPAIIGFIIADIVSEGGTQICHIKDLAVSPSWRKNGIGTKLIYSIFEHFSFKEISSAKLEVRKNNTDAISIYTKLGFSLHHEISNYYPDGENALVLTLNFTQFKIPPKL